MTVDRANDSGATCGSMVAGEKNGPRLVTEGLATTQTRSKERHVMTEHDPTHSQAATAQPPPLCPMCGMPARRTDVRATSSGIHTGYYTDDAGHIWITKWFSGGAA